MELDDLDMETDTEKEKTESEPKPDTENKKPEKKPETEEEKFETVRTFYARGYSITTIVDATSLNKKEVEDIIANISEQQKIIDMYRQNIMDLNGLIHDERNKKGGVDIKLIHDMVKTKIETVDKMAKIINQKKPSQTGFMGFK